MQTGELCPECSEWNVRDWFLGLEWIPWEKPNTSKIGNERVQAREKTTGRRNNNTIRLLQDVQETKNSGCPLCRLVIRTLSKDPVYGHIPDGADVEILYERLAFFLKCDEAGSGKTVQHIVGLGAPRYCNRLVFNTSGWDREGRHPYPVATGSIHMISENHSREPILRGRPVQSQVDFELLKAWLRKCNDDHGSQCHPEPRDEHPKPGFKLIDVNSRAIVHSSVQASFAALSYVWGPQGVRQVTLKHETYSLLTTHGLSEVWEDVPRTIRDAITLCKSIGIPYLWVDQCCIQQDDETDIGQVEYMDVIYGAACLTIVAESGVDSWAGLPGVSPGSREIQQETEIIEGLSIGTAQAGYSAAMSTAIWLTRGWTFQEYILSKRLLIFTPHQVFYQCSKASWWEDTYTEVPSPLTVGLAEPRVDLNSFDRAVIPKPTISPLRSENYLEEYTRLAVQFADRRLTRQSDALRAFEGIIGCFSRATGECFFAGLPLSMFHAALLFEISDPMSEHRRGAFPSWSWTGWNLCQLDRNYIRYEWPGSLSRISWEPEAAFYRIEHSPKKRMDENAVFSRIRDKRTSARSLALYVPRRGWRIAMSSNLLADLGVGNLLAVIAPTITISVSYNGAPWPATRSHANDRLSSSILPWAIRDRMGLACIYLDPSWRKLVGRKAECFAIARESLRGPQGTVLTVVKLMVIYTDKRGVSQRVRLWWFSVEQWERAAVRWKLFLLR